MKRLKKSRKELPEMNTSALPDIVFMLLFFFMVTMVMKDEEPPMNLQMPQAVNVKEVDQKALSLVIWVAEEPNGEFHRVWAEGAWWNTNQIGILVETKRASLPEAAQSMFTTILKADESLPMEAMIKVKQQLRAVQALKIQYSAEPVALHPSSVATL